MSKEEIIFYLCVFGVVALPTYWVSWLVVQRKESQLRRRLGSDRPGPAGGKQGGRQGRSLVKRLSQAAATPLLPKTVEEESELRKQCGYAGLYSPGAARLILGFKMILMVMGVVGGYLAGAALKQPLLGVAFGGLAGYLAPGLWLKYMIRKRQGALERALPEALDLMVVCVESGLTMDSAMQRVGKEITLSHPEMSQELEIVQMESLVGVNRSETLRNLGRRTGVEGLQSLAAMLIQAERFGTSIATSLRIHSDSMRVKRQNAAEEKAARSAVKLSFPLVLCIFPAILIVVGGPAVIWLLDSQLFKN